MRATLCTLTRTPVLVSLHWQFVLYPVSFGALTSLYAGTAPEGNQLNGKVCPSIIRNLRIRAQLLILYTLLLYSIWVLGLECGLVVLI